MFPIFGEIVFVLCYLFAWIAIFFYGLYVVYLLFKRERRVIIHGICLCVWLSILLGINVWQERQPSEIYSFMEDVSPSRKGSAILLREAGFTDNVTFLCVRDYSRSGNKFINIGTIGADNGVHAERETWSSDGSNLIVELNNKKALGYDFGEHRNLDPEEITPLLKSSQSRRQPVQWESFRQARNEEMTGFHPYLNSSNGGGSP